MALQRAWPAPKLNDCQLHREYLQSGQYVHPQLVKFSGSSGRSRRYGVRLSGAGLAGAEARCEFTDTGESFTLQLRNSVPEITPSLTDRTAPVVQLTRAFGNRILRGDETSQSGTDSGAITIRGNPAEVKALHSVFDRPRDLPTPNIALR